MSLLLGATCGSLGEPFSAAETAGSERNQKHDGDSAEIPLAVLLPFRGSCLMVDREGFRFAEKRL